MARVSHVPTKSVWHARQAISRVFHLFNQSKLWIRCLSNLKRLWIWLLSNLFGFSFVQKLFDIQNNKIWYLFPCNYYYITWQKGPTFIQQEIKRQEGPTNAKGKEKASLTIVARNHRWEVRFASDIKHQIKIVIRW